MREFDRGNGWGIDPWIHMLHDSYLGRLCSQCFESHANISFIWCHCRLALLFHFPVLLIPFQMSQLLLYTGAKESPKRNLPMAIFFPSVLRDSKRSICFNLNWPQVPRCCWLVLTELLSHALEFLWLSRHFEFQASRWTVRNWQREKWYQNQRSQKYWCQAKFKWK